MRLSHLPFLSPDKNCLSDYTEWLIEEPNTNYTALSVAKNFAHLMKDAKLCKNN